MPNEIDRAVPTPPEPEEQSIRPQREPVIAPTARIPSPWRYADLPIDMANALDFEPYPPNQAMVWSEQGTPSTAQTQSSFDRALSIDYDLVENSIGAMRNRQILGEITRLDALARQLQFTSPPPPPPISAMEAARRANTERSRNPQRAAPPPPRTRSASDMAQLQAGMLHQAGVISTPQNETTAAQRAVTAAENDELQHRLSDAERRLRISQQDLDASRGMYASASASVSDLARKVDSMVRVLQEHADLVPAIAVFLQREGFTTTPTPAPEVHVNPIYDAGRMNPEPAQRRAFTNPWSF